MPNIGTSTTNPFLDPTKTNSSESVAASSTTEETSTLALSETEEISATTNEDDLMVLEEEDEKSDIIKQYEAQILAFEQELNILVAQSQTIMTKFSLPDSDLLELTMQLSSVNGAKRDVQAGITQLKAGMIKAQLGQYEIAELERQIGEISNGAGAALALMPDFDLGEADTVGENTALLGLSFVGNVNSDAEGNRLFSPNGNTQHWCADFVTYITKASYEQMGEPVPEGFGSSAVRFLRSWAQGNGRFIQTAGTANKAETIATQISPGDIIIQEENGSSHTGIVVKVYPDGSFDTVEGNTSDAVKTRHYDANCNRLTGFIDMT